MIRFKLTADMDILNGQAYAALPIYRQWDFIVAMTLTNTARDVAGAFNRARKMKGVKLSKSQRATVQRATKRKQVAIIGVGRGARRRKSKSVKTIRRSEVNKVLMAERYYGNRLFEPARGNRRNLSGLWVRQSRSRLPIERMYRIVEKQKYVSTKPSLLLLAVARRVVPKRTPVNLKIAIQYASRTAK